MNPVELNYTVDLAKRETRVKELDRSLFFGDKNAYKLNVTVERNGLPEDLTDMSCRGYIVYEGTNTTYQLEVAGISGNVAWVLFDENSLLTTGRASIKVQLTKAADNFALTVFALYGDVKLGITDTIFVPTGSILDINALIDKMEEFDEIIAGAASAISGAENVDIAMTQSDGVFNITTTNRNGQQTTVAIPDPAAEVKKKANRSSVTADRMISGMGKVEFPDALDEPLSLNLKLEPKQDLHGYDKPWVGGSGKNLAKPLGTTETINGVTFTTNADGTVDVNGTATAEASYLYSLAADNEALMPAGNYYLTGCPSGGSASTYYLRCSARSGKNDLGTGISFTLNLPGESLRIIVASGYTANHLLFKPMVVVSTEADRTYEPYSNICPITGYDKVSVTSYGSENLVSGRFHTYSVGPNGITQSANQFSTYYARVKKGEEYILVSDDGQAVYGYIDADTVETNSLFCSEYPTRFIEKMTKSGSIYYIVITAKINGWIAWRGALDFRQGAIYNGTQLPENYIAPNTNPTLTLNLTSAAGGTVYGGTVTVNEDGSGELVVDKKYVALADLGWTRSVSDGIPVFYAIIADKENNADNTGLSDYFPIRETNATSLTDATTTADKTIALSKGTSNPYVYARYDSCTSVSSFTSVIAGSHLVYSLANPTTYPLTASQINSLLGYTQVITDTDGVLTVGYKTDKYAKLEKFLAAFPGDGKLVAGTNTQATKNNAVATGNRTTASGANSHAEGNGTTASGQDSHAEGQNTTASQGSAHAEGISTTASGFSGAHAEGANTESSGQTSHAEGYKAKAQGKYSHAQGNETTASGESSHAEGYKTVASGKGAHAEGQETVAAGMYSHAEGYGTHAGLYNHVFGSYNVKDISGDFIEIVGNGSSDSARHNARTLDWDGNEALAGSLTIGMGTADEVTLTAAQLKALLALLP